MPKTKKPRSRKAATKNTFLFDGQGGKLHALMRNMARKPQAPAFDIWEQKADDIIERHLKSSQDSVFDEALFLAEDFDVLEETLLSIEVCAQQSFAFGNTVGSNGEADVVAINLFAVPVIVESLEGLDSHVHLDADSAALDSLTKSFKKHGLASKEATVALVGYLYHETELELPFSNVRRLAEQIVKCSFFNEPMTNGALARTGKTCVDLDWDGMATETYYLVGVIVDGIGNPPSFGLDADFSQEKPEESAMTAAFDLAKQRESLWKADAQGILTSMLARPDATLSLGTPDDFFAAYRQGRSLCETLMLSRQIGLMLQENLIAPGGAKAIVAYYADEESGHVEIGVSIVSLLTGELVDAEVRPFIPREDPDILASEVVDALNAIGIERIEFIDGIQPVAYCPCCNKRTFEGLHKDDLATDDDDGQHGNDQTGDSDGARPRLLH